MKIFDKPKFELWSHELFTWDDLNIHTILCRHVMNSKENKKIYADQDKGSPQLQTLEIMLWTV